MSSNQLLYFINRCVSSVYDSVICDFLTYEKAANFLPNCLDQINMGFKKNRYYLFVKFSMQRCFIYILYSCCAIKNSSSTCGFHDEQGNRRFKCCHYILWFKNVSVLIFEISFKNKPVYDCNGKHFECIKSAYWFTQVVEKAKKITMSN